MRQPVDIEELRRVTHELNQKDRIIRREQRKLSIVSQIIIEANEAISYDALLQNALKSILISLEFDRGIISYLFPDFDESIIHTVNIPDVKAFQFCTYLSKERILQSKQIQEVLDFAETYPKIAESYQIQKAIISPIPSPLGILGYIQLFSSDPRPLEEDMRQILTMISHHLGNSLVRVFYEKKLEKERTNFKNLFEESKEGILILNEQYSIVHVNRAMTEMVGKPLKEIVSRPVVEFLSINPGCLSSILMQVDPEKCQSFRSTLQGESVEVNMNNVSWNSKPAIAVLVRRSQS